MKDLTFVQVENIATLLFYLLGKQSGTTYEFEVYKKEKDDRQPAESSN